MAACTAVKEKLLEFLSDTTLHGVRYLSLNKANVARKLMWLVVFVTCVSAFLFTFVSSILDYYEYDTDIRIDVKHPGW